MKFSQTNNHADWNHSLCRGGLMYPFDSFIYSSNIGLIIEEFNWFHGTNSSDIFWKKICLKIVFEKSNKTVPVGVILFFVHTSNSDSVTAKIYSK